MSRDSLPEIPEPEKQDDQPQEQKSRIDEVGGQLRGAGQASTIGFILVVSILIGYGIGTWLDSRLGTGQTCMAVGVVVGSIAGFVEMFRIAIRASKK